MKRRRQIEVFSISFLDLLSGALGAVIILYVAMPKAKPTSQDHHDAKLADSIEKTLKETQEELRKVNKELAETQQKMSQMSSKPTEKREHESGKDLDIGFKFKGKKIVFIIDTSYSMLEEDRIGQVKAGLKMLITSLDKNYSVEVIQYPYEERSPFRYLWGELKNNTGLNKMDVFDFIYGMRPLGGTPTREALLFALRNYTQLSDIVLLSDGTPTYHNSNKKDDIYEILRVVRLENKNKVQINCIGVGSEFIKDKTSDRYKFLSLLAEEGDGFFVGF